MAKYNDPFCNIFDGMAFGAVTVNGLNYCIDSERGIMGSGDCTNNAIGIIFSMWYCSLLREWYFQLLDQL